MCYILFTGTYRHRAYFKKWSGKTHTHFSIVGKGKKRIGKNRTKGVAVFLFL